jgi:DNA polymerase I-like protein with 3'-5' exonuclease and polymerase domains
MLVSTKKQGIEVIKYLFSQKWVALDTETVSITKDPDDTLVHGRHRVYVWSACHKGESYCFPTSRFNSAYPTFAFWASLLQPHFLRKDVIKVAHNWNYDGNVFFYENLRKCFNFWDTMIGCWAASEYREKGLKQRAPLYGRYLRDTKAVKFENLKELGDYAEGDVIQTDEQFQMQTRGFIDRRKSVIVLGPDKKWHLVKNRLPSGKIVIENENLNDHMKNHIRYQEHPILRSTMRAEQVGILAHRQRLYVIRKKLAVDKRIVLKKLYMVGGHTLNLNSSKQLIKLVQDKLKLTIPLKTKSGAPSLNADSLFHMQAMHPFIGNLIRYRQLEKLEGTYVGNNEPIIPAPIPGSKKKLKSKKKWGIEAFINEDGRIHCNLNTVGAITGRYSSSNPNMQNQPSRNDIYGLRRCYIAPKGKLLVVLDYSQLELRVMAMRSKDEKMLTLLNDVTQDIHQNTADQFGVDRNPTAKQLNFLLLYGGGAFMLAGNLSAEGVPTTVKQADVYYNRYNEVYPMVQDYRLWLLAMHQKFGFVRFLTGRTRHLPDVNWHSKRSIHKAETTLANNTIQGDGQDLLKASIVRSDWMGINPDRAILEKGLWGNDLHKAYLKDRVAKLEKYRRLFKLSKTQFVLQVHDEALNYTEASAAPEVGAALADIMTWRHYFPIAVKRYQPVTLAVEGGIADNWGDAKSKDRYMYKIEAGYHAAKVTPNKNLSLVS